MDVCVIGVGNMGRALLESLKRLEGIRLLAIDHKPLNLEGVETVNDYTRATSCEAVIVCVKPNAVGSVLAELSKAWPARPPIVISVAARVRLETLSSGLPKGAQVVRAMPNIAASTGRAITCFAVGDSITAYGLKTVHKVLGAAGKAIAVSEEDFSAVTALNGCGPAYFFYFTNSLAKAGAKMGLDEGLSAKIALSLMKSSGKLTEGGESLEKLISRVATPGGSTEAALKKFEENGFQAVLDEALAAAKKKCDGLA